MGVQQMPAGIEFSYNGVAFSPFVRTKLVLEPVQSGDNRMVKCSKLTIQASGSFTSADIGSEIAIDDFMSGIERDLQVNGKALHYEGKGYGPLVVNDPADSTSVDDVMFGPKPGPLVWWPLGGVPDCRAAGFEWSVTTWIAECEEFESTNGVFLEISYSVTYETGIDGILTISHRGTAQIPLSLRSDNTIDRTIDDSLADIFQLPSPGFQRSTSHTLSPDRASCQFSVTDRQMEIPPPDDTIEISMDHTVEQERPYAPLWTCMISGNLRMSPTANKYLAWARFFNIAAQRMTYSRTAIIANGPFNGNSPPGIVLGKLKLRESLFKNESSFSISYRLLGAPIAKILSQSSLWRPILDAQNPPLRQPWTAESWSQSLQNNAHAFRGVLSATFDGDLDVILDVCSGEFEGHVANPAQSQNQPQEIAELQQNIVDSDLQDIEPNGLPFNGDAREAANNPVLFPPETSWLEFQCAVRRLVDHNQIRHKPLSGDVTYQDPIVDPFSGGAEVAEFEDDPSPGTWTATEDDIIQQVASPSLTVRVIGFAVRVANRVNPPRLISYGGKTATLVSEDVQEIEKGMSDDVSIFRTDWDLVYYISGQTDNVPKIANPMLGTDGSGGSDSPSAGKSDSGGFMQFGAQG